MSNDSGKSGSGGQLRWWQEETPSRRTSEPRWYATPVQSASSGQLPAVLSESLDVTEELEAEARRRSLLERDAVVIGTDIASYIRRKFLLINGILLLGLLDQSVEFYRGHDPIHLMGFTMMLAMMVFGPLWMKDQLQKTSPQVSISALGLNIQMDAYRIGPIFWNEIQSVGVRKVPLLGYSYLQIELKDPEEVFRRAFHIHREAGQLLKRDDFLRYCHPIHIDESYFSISAEEIAAKIATFGGGYPSDR